MKKFETGFTQTFFKPEARNEETRNDKIETTLSFLGWRQE